MKADIRRKEKVEKTIEFAERMKKEAGAVLIKAQKEMRWQADKGKKTKEWKKKDKMMLNMKDLVFKEQLANKFVDWYIGSYIIDEVVSTNTIRLQLPTSMRIYLVINISQVVWYKE